MKRLIATFLFLTLIAVYSGSALSEVDILSCTEAEQNTYEALITPYGNEFSLLIEERLAMESAVEITDWAIRYEDFYHWWYQDALVESPDCAAAIRHNNYLTRYFTEVYMGSLYLYVGITENALEHNAGIILRDFSDGHTTTANDLFNDMAFSFEIDSDLNQAIIHCSASQKVALHSTLQDFVSNYDHLSHDGLLPPAFSEALDTGEINAALIELNELQVNWWAQHDVHDIHCQETLEATALYGELIDSTIIYTLTRQMLLNRSLLIETTGENLSMVEISVEAQEQHNAQVGYIHTVRNEIDTLLETLLATG